MVPLMFAVVMRKGKKEVGMGHSRMLMCCVCSMRMRRCRVQMEGRQEQQRREKHCQDPSTPR
jgi:hypothetical protein